MKKRFNTTGLCLKDRHYMVDSLEKMNAITKLVDGGDYFVINRARQYGKTTTLYLLAEELKNRYIVFSLSFEGIGKNAFENENSFCKTFCRLMEREILFKKTTGVNEEIIQKLKELTRNDNFDFLTLTDIFLELCQYAVNPVVLLIDEVDQASNYQTFIDFLGLLRNNFLQRGRMPAFHSVVLAGVYDIKNLKLKIRPKGEHQYNSPWNIASDFKIDMSFHTKEISQMLIDYEKENHTGMDVWKISEIIYEYTSGYPYMVSKICKLIDEEITESKIFPSQKDAWTKQGILEAVKIILKEENTLFDDMQKKLTDFPELKIMLYRILFNGERFSFEMNNNVIDLGIKFGFLSEKDNTVIISNRIFETKLYNIFISEEETESEIYKAATIEKNQFIIHGELSMDLVMEKFLQHFTEIYSDSDDKFVEENGRRLFLLYLKPIINGTGNYYIESQTRDLKRTDVIVDYKGKQSIIELKIWHGSEYNQRGEKQLFEYLDYYKKENGYLLSFNFNKNKVPGIQKIKYNDKEILEIVC